MTTANEVYARELRKVLRHRLRGTMTPTENVLYFPNNIDVRICPKNGMSSLKWAMLYVYGVPQDPNDRVSLTMGTKVWRMEDIKKHGHKPDLPFRKDSYKTCVSRDPIKRFMSACEYIKTEYASSAEMLSTSESLTVEQLERLSRLSDVNPLPDSLDDIIEGVWTGEIQNSHFFTQTYYHGNRGQYDKIWNMSDFKPMMEWLRTETKCSRKIDKIHSNYTSGQWFGGFELLTPDQKKRIMRIYEEDYDYGWTED